MEDTMRTKIALFLIALTLIASPAAAGAAFPSVISLPNGWLPEGIAIGDGTTFYAGSRQTGPTGGIYRGDLSTGEGSIFVTGGGPYTGMKVDDFGRLWVAGAGTGRGYVFDATTSELLETFQFVTDANATFINDVVVTKDAAFFTDSNRQVLYRVDIDPSGEIDSDTVTNLPLTGIQFVAGFNLNGIDATPNGMTLIVVNSSTGRLYAVDPTTGAADEIELAGGATVTQGDGILLHGNTLYVVRNRSNEIVVIELAPDLSSGTVVDTITSPTFDVPTTIARHGNALYAVNARFSTTPTPTTPYTVVRVEP
jgi:sugar lactone lactonase YvrE